MAAALAAIFMHSYAKKIYVVYRGKKLRAEPVSAEKVYGLDKVEVIHEANVAEIFGEKTVNKIKLDTGKELVVDGVFIEVGHIPLSQIAKGLGVTLDERGFIQVDRDKKTNVSGVFAAGDISNGTSLKQFITSAAEGSIAAQSAYFHVSKSS